MDLTLGVLYLATRYRHFWTDPKGFPISTKVVLSLLVLLVVVITLQKYPRIC